MCMRVSPACMPVYRCVPRGQKQVSGPLGLELQAPVSHYRDAGAQTWSCGRIASTLNW